MGSGTSKGVFESATAVPALLSVRTSVSTATVTITSTPIQTPAIIQPAPAVVSTLSLISTLIESEPVRFSTIRATETVIQSIIISVTPTPTPNLLNPSSSSRELPASGPSASPQRAAATGPAAQSASKPSSTPAITLSEKQGKGPFAPPDAILGGIPNKKIDLPITLVFLVFFMTGAATHFTIHEVNGKRGHKFHLSDLVFDFCMVRTVTCTMRIVWIFRPNNNSVVLAALIFEGAGVVVLFAVNTFFTQRIIRSIHPQIGWSAPATKLFWGIIVSVPTIIVWNIINASLSVFLIQPKQAATIHDLVIFGSCYTLFLCTIPITFLGFTALFPPSTPPERFGKGGLHAKILILIIASSILTVGAVIRLVTTVKVRPKDDPGALNSKAVFYITGFMLEIMVVVMYALARVDLRFYVPDGCTGPGDYSRPKAVGVEDDRDNLVEYSGDEKTRASIGSDYTDDYTNGGGIRRMSGDLEGYPALAAPDGNSTQIVGGATPRRPPRSMRWEGRERGGEDIDARGSVI